VAREVTDATVSPLTDAGVVREGSREWEGGEQMGTATGEGTGTEGNVEAGTRQGEATVTHAATAPMWCDCDTLALASAAVTARARAWR